MSMGWAFLYFAEACVCSLYLLARSANSESYPYKVVVFYFGIIFAWVSGSGIAYAMVLMAS